MSYAKYICDAGFLEMFSWGCIIPYSTMETSNWVLPKLHSDASVSIACPEIIGPPEKENIVNKVTVYAT